MNSNTESEYSFIINVFKTFWPDLPITQNTLDHPTSEFVWKFYEHVQISLNEIVEKVIDSDEIATDEQPKSENDALFYLLRFINKYLKKFNTDKGDNMMLTLTDLYAPTAMRTKVFVKVLINLFLFYDQTIDQIKNTVNYRILQLQDNKTEKCEIEELKIELARAAEKYAHNEDKCLNIENINKQVEAQYSTLQTEKEDVNRFFNSLKHDLKMLYDTYQNKVTLLENVKGNRQHLLEQIVSCQSYKSLQDLKENQLQKHNDLNSEIRSLVTMYQAKTPVIECFHRNNTQMDILVILSEEAHQLLTIVNKNHAAITTFQLKKDKDIIVVKKNKNDIRNLKEEIQGKKEQLKTTAEKSIHIISQIERDCAQINEEITEEKNIFAILSKKKLALEEEIIKQKQRLANVHNDIENAKVFNENMYKNIIIVENVVANKFNNALQNIQFYLTANKN